MNNIVRFTFADGSSETVDEAELWKGLYFQLKRLDELKRNAVRDNGGGRPPKSGPSEYSVLDQFEKALHKNAARKTKYKDIVNSARLKVKKDLCGEFCCDAKTAEKWLNDYHIERCNIPDRPRKPRNNKKE